MFIASEKVSLDDWLERLLRAQLIANSWIARLAGTSFYIHLDWCPTGLPDEQTAVSAIVAPWPHRGQQSG
jgi:hypothetical protein